MILPSLADAESRLRSLLPGQAPAPFVASDPASQGGASSPLLWLAVGLVINFAAVADAAAFFDLRSAMEFCTNPVAQAAVTAILVPLIALLLNYRAKNKQTAASVAIAAQQAAGNGAPPAVASGAGAAP